jgi:peptide/nickel transport system substrate-binding protein
MHRKSLLSLFMLSMGVALVAAAMIVGTASAKTQRTASNNVLTITQAPGAFDTLDPQLSYVSNDWGLLYNTEMTLLNFPTKPGAAGTKLIPEAATGFPTISNGGKTYTFHIRSGLKLSNGQPITAANFVRSFERNISPKMYAPFGVYDGLNQFLVGGQAFFQGKANTISGLSAKGLTLTIHLTQVVPQFSSIMGMPWFQAIPSNLPYAPKKSTILKYAGGGPYYIASNDLTHLTVLKRNAHFPSSSYFRSNWPSDPTEIVVKSYPTSNGTPQLLQAEKNQVDIAAVHSQDVSSVISKYGNGSNAKGRFHVGVTTCVDWLSMNAHSNNGTTGSDGSNGFNVRKALSDYISRNAVNTLAGKLSGVATDGILVPAVPGYHNFSVYPANGTSLSVAKSDGGPALNNAPLRIYYDNSSTYQTNVAEYIQSQASKLGMNPVLVGADPDDFYGNLEDKSYSEGPNGYNISAFGGWCADYADGYDYINVNFDGRNIVGDGNTDYMYFNNSTFDADMDHAASLSGSARATAYGKLDQELIKNYSPVIPTEISNTRFLTSDRVHNWVYSTWWGQPFWGAIKLS